MEDQFLNELDLDPRELEAARLIAEEDIKNDNEDSEYVPRDRKIIKSPGSVK